MSALVSADLASTRIEWEHAYRDLEEVARDPAAADRIRRQLEAVTADKAARLRRLAAAWIVERQVHPADVRVDLVGVVRGRTGGPAAVEHVRGVA